MAEIVQWSDIAEDFGDTLIVGNGGSMAVDTCFSYKTLLGEARDGALVSANVEKVFDYFNTEDFELVLRMLWHTYHVNQALGIEDKVTTEAYRSVRGALINAIRTIHPAHEQVASHLDSIGPFMARFRTVHSLNYDLLVYWAMLRENEKRGQWFKDGFVQGKFDSEYERLYQPYGGADGATLVFYPHGNLVLATQLDRGEIKIRRPDDWADLLDSIVAEWETENSVPLFVSEGLRRQKEAAIMRSSYLGTVYQVVLPETGSNVTIYGWGMALQDTHILRQLRRAGVDRLAVSVFTSRDPDKIDAECERVRLRLKSWLPGCSVVFFDSASPGCWNNP